MRGYSTLSLGHQVSNILHSSFFILHSSFFILHSSFFAKYDRYSSVVQQIEYEVADSRSSCRLFLLQQP